MFSVISVVVVLGGLIFFHELGHFLAAKSFRVGVKTFSLGFGPKLFGFMRGNTLYQVAAFPLGGYVSMVGEADPKDIPEPFTIEDSFACRPAWQRLIIVAAGPFFNLFLTWVLFWGLFFSLGQAYLLPEVGSVQAGTPAASADIQPGDTVLAVNGVDIERWSEITKAVTEGGGAPLTLSILRDGAERSITVTPAPFVRKTIFGEEKTSWAMGLIAAEKTGHVRFGFFEASYRSLDHTWFMTKLIGESIVKLFERVVPLDTVSGPIRIVKEIHNQASTDGIVGVLFIAAFISLNLGLLNLLPIPVLDGGHILFLLIETLTGKALPESVQEYGARIGIALLLFLMVFATYNDITQWVTKGL
ncbi:RIP metalloprotease RseP [Desulfovibrio sp. OttesenSCG-928-I05]|nr:RIP metalloprotease RseP [Desulfovibrio sp. OttesenSCG-928-I05]